MSSCFVQITPLLLSSSSQESRHHRCPLLSPGLVGTGFCCDSGQFHLKAPWPGGGGGGSQRGIVGIVLDLRLKREYLFLLRKDSLDQQKAGLRQTIELCLEFETFWGGGGGGLQSSSVDLRHGSQGSLEASSFVSKSRPSCGVGGWRKRSVF